MLPAQKEGMEAAAQTRPCPAAASSFSSTSTSSSEEVSATEHRKATKSISLEEFIVTQPGKTPSQLLHEYGIKANLTPVYELEKAEGQVHLPVFTFKVTVGDVTGTGDGPSKKTAKQRAAEAALNILRVNSGICISVPDHITPESFKQETKQDNPIGLLQELAIEKGWGFPQYLFAQESGLPHKREFTVTCRTETFVETGTGPSKKTAKRNAAEKLLDRVYSFCADNAPLALGNEQSQKLVCPWGTLKNPSGEKITLLKMTSLSIPNTDYVELLEEVANEQGFNAAYLNIEEQSVNGQYQCLAKLSTFPITVCHGTGTSWDNAHNDAAHSALQYLKIMAGRK